MSAHTITVDANLLRRRAEAASHSRHEMQRHIDAEVTNEIEVVMGTLAPEEPYAYTAQPVLAPDGTLIRQPILRTRDEVRAGYVIIHDKAILTGLVPLTEIHGDWYTFVDGIGSGIQKATGHAGESDSLILFPTGDVEGITGELFWNRHPPFAENAPPGLGAPVEGGRRACHAAHERFLAALRAGDAGSLDSLMDEGVQTAVRDYVDDTGTLVALDGKAAVRPFYDRFFDKFEIESVDLLCRAVSDWYAFAEMRYTTRMRSGEKAGATASFNTAEYCVYAPDARVIVRIGHGTDLELD